MTPASSVARTASMAPGSSAGSSGALPSQAERQAMPTTLTASHQGEAGVRVVDHPVLSGVVSRRIDSKSSSIRHLPLQTDYSHGVAVPMSRHRAPTRPIPCRRRTPSTAGSCRHRPNTTNPNEASSAPVPAGALNPCGPLGTSRPHGRSSDPSPGPDPPDHPRTAETSRMGPLRPAVDSTSRGQRDVPTFSRSYAPHRDVPGHRNTDRFSPGRCPGSRTRR